MMVMGYFRSSPKKSGGGGRRRNDHDDDDDALRETLLDQPAASPSSSPATSPTTNSGGGGGVPKGYFAVYVGEEARRFVVPTDYLREPAFRELMERAADEFGFAQSGGLRVPCDEVQFEDLLRQFDDTKNTGRVLQTEQSPNRAIIELPLPVEIRQSFT
uniref:Auxin-responsive protein n=1 Tax=Leersia perrieri TaxID=77586 RepID=A0A0D9WTT4_9ORYZ